MIEYWLQKKTLGGWSQVTWYSDYEQAYKNFLQCVGKGNSGYSWRLVRVDNVHESLLAEVTPVEAPVIDPPKPSPIKNSGWGATPTASGWGKPIQDKPVASGWGDIPSQSAGPEHGMTGKVWLIHHLLRQRVRVNPDEVDKYLANGFERGGPKTVFRE